METKLQSGGTLRLNEKLEKQKKDSQKVITKMIIDNVNKDDRRPTIPLAAGDPSVFPSFRTATSAEDAIVDSVRSAKFNNYAPIGGTLQTKRAIAEYLSCDLPYKLSPDKVYVTAGTKHAIEVVVTVLAAPGANILLPRPGFQRYEDHATFHGLEFRYVDLLPEKAWEVDLDAVEKLADENTAAIVIINPGNPCGNLYSFQHLNKIAETARKLGIIVISDEVYGHITFGSNPFVPMGIFGSIVPVITLGSLSKRWLVPGWRLGWLVVCDPVGKLKESGLDICLRRYIGLCAAEPATFIQAAVPQILEKTTKDFHSRIVDLLRELAGICYESISEIPCFTCPTKPEASMFVMVKLNLSLLEDISDDMEFCLKLAKEECVLTLPGSVVGLKNWLRITFACEQSLLQDGLERMKGFCHRHAKKKPSVIE